MKPIILECENNFYKFKLPFSVLCKLRDEGIDFLGGSAWVTMEQEVKNIVPVIKAGIEYSEGREIGDEIVKIVDDLMETIGFQGIYNKIMEAISIKGAYDSEDLETSEEGDIVGEQEEEKEEGKKQKA